MRVNTGRPFDLYLGFRPPRRPSSGPTGQLLYSRPLYSDRGVVSVAGVPVSLSPPLGFARGRLRHRGTRSLMVKAWVSSTITFARCPNTVARTGKLPDDWSKRVHRWTDEAEVETDTAIGRCDGRRGRSKCLIINILPVTRWGSIFCREFRAKPMILKKRGWGRGIDELVTLSRNGKHPLRTPSP